MQESSKQFGGYLFIKKKIFSPALSLGNKECLRGLGASLEALEEKGSLERA